MRNKLYIAKLILLFVCFSYPVTAADKTSLETGTGLDAAMRWRGYSLLRIDKWSFGLSGRLDTTYGSKGMAGVNSPFLALGHLSDSGLASELRNPSFTALGRLAEKTYFRADLRSFSDSRYGAALYTPTRKFGIAAEHRTDADAGLVWLSPIQTDFYTMELIWTVGRLFPDTPDTSWYPDEPAHPGGVITSAAARNSLNFGPWLIGLSTIVSGGESFRPGLLFAVAADASRKAWATRFRWTWASEFYRNADGEILDVPVGIAWNGRLTPRFGFIVGGDFQLPLVRSRWNTKTDDETGKLEVGWQFNSARLLFSVNWIGLSSTPRAERLGSELSVKLGKLQLGLRGKWILNEEWSLRLEVDSQITPVLGIGVTTQIYEESELRFNGGLNMTIRIKRTRLMLRFKAADLPGDWIHGPTSANDMDIEIRWMQEL